MSRSTSEVHNERWANGFSLSVQCGNFDRVDSFHVRLHPLFKIRDGLTIYSFFFIFIFLILIKGVTVVTFNYRGSCTALCLISLTFLAGCGGGVKPPVEKLVSGSGTIKVDGNPVGGVRIRLAPINDTKSVGGAWAVTKEDGTFTLTHWSGKEGVTPGSYLVTFSKYVKPDGSPLGEKDSPALVGAKELIAPQWSNPQPEQMAALARRVDIPDSGKADIDFSITLSGS